MIRDIVNIYYNNKVGSMVKVVKAFKKYIDLSTILVRENPSYITAGIKIEIGGFKLLEKPLLGQSYLWVDDSIINFDINVDCNRIIVSNMWNYVLVKNKMCDNVKILPRPIDPLYIITSHSTKKSTMKNDTWKLVFFGNISNEVVKRRKMFDIYIKVCKMLENKFSNKIYCKYSDKYTKWDVYDIIQLLDEKTIVWGYSLAEGFGLPVYEALSRGASIIYGFNIDTKFNTELDKIKKYNIALPLEYPYLTIKYNNLEYAFHRPLIDKVQDIVDIIIEYINSIDVEKKASENIKFIHNFYKDYAFRVKQLFKL